MSCEKELNAYLFDQLSIVERIEDSLQEGGIEAAQKTIAKIKKEIERKLYQQPPLTSNK